MVISGRRAEEGERLAEELRALGAEAEFAKAYSAIAAAISIRTFELTVVTSPPAGVHELLFTV